MLSENKLIFFKPLLKSFKAGPSDKGQMAWTLLPDHYPTSCCVASVPTQVDF